MAELARFSRVCAVVVGALIGVAACTAHRVPPPSTDIDEYRFRDDVRVLASDDFEGRRPGTPGEAKTLAYLVDRLRKLGLKPGNGDSYLQSVPMVEMLAGVDATLSIAGRGSVNRLTYGKQMMVWTERESAQASLQHSELVFAGYGIVAPEYQWNDYAQTDVHGKTVVVMVGDPGSGSHDPRTFKGNALTSYGLWSYKVDEAARQGAAGVLLIDDAGAAGTPWNLVVADHSRPQLELEVPDGHAGRPAVDGWLAADATRALFAQAGLDFAVLTAAAARPGFKAVPMGLSADATVENALRKFTSSNVAAFISGSGRKREYVLFTAHWDHLGRQAAEAGGAVLGGAVDDAAGVAGLLALAQSFSRTQPKPDRSIAFVAFTGGDAGLLGSAYYVDHAVFPLRQTAAVLNLDLMHVGGPTRDVMVFGYGNSELEDYLRDAALLQGREVRPDPDPEWGLYYRSEQFSFALAGVPALYARAGLDDSARGPEWGQAQLRDYMAHRFRQVGDRYSADWDVRGTLDDLRLYLDVGNRLARSRRFPRWYPNSEFRASRNRISAPGTPEGPGTPAEPGAHETPAEPGPSAPR